MMAHEKFLEDLIREGELLFQTQNDSVSATPPVVTNVIPEHQSLGADQAALLADLHVELTIELGQVSLGVAELLDLVPGCIVNYKLEQAATFRLRLGDSIIGEGRFVERNGQTGIEVVALSAEGAMEVPTLDGRNFSVRSSIIDSEAGAETVSDSSGSDMS